MRREPAYDIFCHNYEMKIIDKINKAIDEQRCFWVL